MLEEEEGSTVILQGCRAGLVNRKYSIYLYNKHTINWHYTPPAPRISLATVKLYYKPSRTEFSLLTEVFCSWFNYINMLFIERKQGLSGRNNYSCEKYQIKGFGIELEGWKYEEVSYSYCVLFKQNNGLLSCFRDCKCAELTINRFE